MTCTKAEAPPGAPEEYRAILGEVHELIRYDVARMVVSVCRRQLPTIVQDEVRAERRRMFGGRDGHTDGHNPW